MKDFFELNMREQLEICLKIIFRHLLTQGFSTVDDQLTMLRALAEVEMSKESIDGTSKNT